MPHTYTIDELLQHITSLLTKQSDQVLLEQFGIGVSQYRILRTLQMEPRTPQQDIARELGQTEASISRQVKLMAAGGLLQSVRSPKDQRVHLTMVTAKGSRLCEAAAAVLARYLKPTVSVLNDRQKEQFVALLEQIHGQLCIDTHGPPPTSSKS